MAPPWPVAEEFTKLELTTPGQGLFLEDGDAGLQVRRLDVRHQPPGEAADQTVLDVLELRRLAVRADDDLFVPLVEGVERVEELLLTLPLVAEELDVVDQEDVHVAVALLELGHLRGADRLDELVQELLRAEVERAQPGRARERIVADGVHQVRLAEPDAAPDKERIVRLAGHLRDGKAGRVGQPVGLAHDEGGHNQFKIIF